MVLFGFLPPVLISFASVDSYILSLLCIFVIFLVVSIFIKISNALHSVGYISCDLLRNFLTLYLFFGTFPTLNGFYVSFSFCCVFSFSDCYGIMFNLFAHISFLGDGSAVFSSSLVITETLVLFLRLSFYQMIHRIKHLQLCV